MKQASSRTQRRVGTKGKAGRQARRAAYLRAFRGGKRR